MISLSKTQYSMVRNLYVCVHLNKPWNESLPILFNLSDYVKALKGPPKARIMKQIIIYSLLYFFRIKHICIKIKPKIYFPFPQVINTKINLSRFFERFCQPVSQNIAPDVYLRKAVKKNCGIFLAQLWNLYLEYDFSGLEENLMLSPFSFHCVYEWMNTTPPQKKKVPS